MAEASSNPLKSIIAGEIASHGPLTFARYMDLALYHPEFGYYRTRNRFGKHGDFYTAEQLQPVFGDIVSHFVDKLTKPGELPKKFSVLELGAGRAAMRHALRRFKYIPFDWKAPAFPERIEGLVFANEFFDALPVHLLVKTREAWRELYVEAREDGFRFIEGALSTDELGRYADAYGQNLSPGHRLEACLDVPSWLERVAQTLVRGDLLVIDYGYEPRELRRFPEGSLMAYRKHQSSLPLLENPGEQDITAHVNLTWLCDCAVHAGLRFHSSSTLSSWILSIWDEGELMKLWKQTDQQWKLQWKQLLFGFGEVFRVVRFQK